MADEAKKVLTAAEKVTAAKDSGNYEDITVTLADEIKAWKVKYGKLSLHEIPVEGKEEPVEVITRIPYERELDSYITKSSNDKNKEGSTKIAFDFIRRLALFPEVKVLDDLYLVDKQYGFPTSIVGKILEQVGFGGDISTKKL